MFTKIINLQIQLNENITPDWRSKDWELAILREGSEAIDSTAWKWWKAGSDNIENLKIEAIDLLHFIISYGLSRLYTSDSIDDIVHELDETMHEEWEIALDDQAINMQASITDMLKQLLSANLAYHLDPSERFSKMTYWLFALLMKLGMSNDDIQALYLTKNLLNEYRQLRGYKDPNGNYRKVINGVEDNVYFLKIVKEVGVNAENLREKAFAKMDEV